MSLVRAQTKGDAERVGSQEESMDYLSLIGYRYYILNFHMRACYV